MSGSTRTDSSWPLLWSTRLLPATTIYGWPALVTEAMREVYASRKFESSLLSGSCGLGAVAEGCGGFCGGSEAEAVAATKLCARTRANARVCVRDHFMEMLLGQWGCGDPPATKIDEYAVGGQHAARGERSAESDY